MKVMEPTELHTCMPTSRACCRLMRNSESSPENVILFRSPELPLIYAQWKPVCLSQSSSEREREREREGERDSPLSREWVGPQPAGSRFVNHGGGEGEGGGDAREREGGRERERELT